MRRLRRSDGLSRIVQAAAGDDLDLTDAEFAAVRHLLENEKTWVLAGQGTVEDVAARIASCLVGRSAENALAAGRAIAGGLLEFAVRDLEPEWFRQVLFARLERMQADQVSALDQALFGVQCDLAALLAAHDAADEGRFAGLTGLLSQVLDRLPVGTADQGELAVYLARLIRWLNTDPWPQDARFGGPVLAPADIERKLRVAGLRGQRDLDADELGRRCVRLVVLGGPGSGKTWFAKRTARLCAEAALEALAGGALPDEVELPLYTTCARLSVAPVNEGIRSALVSSALSQLPDMGGARVTAAVRVIFEERSTQTLLVADSLDEAAAPDDRVRLTDSLPTAWRIVLTSRPSAWNRQLAIGDSDPERQVGFLQPLEYPGDVEPFITRWFSSRPGWGAELKAQIRSRPPLQQAATIPLILAFYCIVGAGQPLPIRRSDLYTKVIRRMLTGRWRGDDGGGHDPDRCLERLRDWAWSAAASDFRSGTGVWADELLTPRTGQSQAELNALGHVAVAFGPEDLDTGMTRRRFVHRSIREHLVAEYIAFNLSPVVAAAELISHLWYDPDWEYAAPAALALHPQRDLVLRDLMRRIRGNGADSADLATIDGCWEIRRFLAATARESAERDWASDTANLIGQARHDLVAVRPDTIRDIFASAWPESNAVIIQSLLNLLADGTDPWTARELADAITWLDPSANDLTRARVALFRFLDSAVNPATVRAVATVIAGLNPSAEDRARLRAVLLSCLDNVDGPQMAWKVVMAIAMLNPSANDRTQAIQSLLVLIRNGTSPGLARDLAQVLEWLAPSAEDRARVRTVLLSFLCSVDGPGVAREVVMAIAALNPSADDRTQAIQALLTLITSATDPGRARDLADAFVGLAVSSADRARVRAVLVAHLDDEIDPRIARDVAGLVARMDPSVEDLYRARAVLLRLLQRENAPGKARDLADAIIRLDPQDEDLSRAQGVLSALLSTVINRRSPRDLADALGTLAVSAKDRTWAMPPMLWLLDNAADPGITLDLAGALRRLDPSADDLARARDSLLRHLAGTINPWDAAKLTDALKWLDPSADDLSRAREPLLWLLHVEVLSYPAQQLAKALASLAPTADELARSRAALLRLLEHTTRTAEALDLARTVGELNPTPADRTCARTAMQNQFDREVNDIIRSGVSDAVARLAVTAQEQALTALWLLDACEREPDSSTAAGLARLAGRLNPSADNLARARTRLLAMLDIEDRPGVAQHLAEAIAGLSPSAEDRTRAVLSLVRLLESQTYGGYGLHLGPAEAIVRLAPAAEDLARARTALVRLLIIAIRPVIAQRVADVLVRLSPTVSDLYGSDGWPFPPTTAVLAAARRNSEISAWLGALPGLSTSTRPQLQVDTASPMPDIGLSRRISIHLTSLLSLIVSHRRVSGTDANAGPSV
jgi:hypothetical protein